MYAPAGVTQEEGHTGLLHLPSAVLAVISTARRIQPSFSLVNRQVELHFQQSRVWIKRVWLPRSAKQETCFLPSPSLRLKVWHCETDSTISSRVSLFIIHSQAVYGTFSRDSSRFLQQHPQILPTPIRSAPSLSGHTIGCRKRLLPRILRHRVSCPQGSSSKGYRLFRHRWALWYLWNPWMMPTQGPYLPCGRGCTGDLLSLWVPCGCPVGRLCRVSYFPVQGL